jgi:hypothetical protein
MNSTNSTIPELANETQNLTEIDSIFLRQIELTDSKVDTSLYKRIKKYGETRLALEFGLHGFDNAIGRITGHALYYHHQSGTTVMVVSKYPHDTIKITGRPDARAETRADVERLAVEIGLPLCDIIENERERYL